VGYKRHISKSEQGKDNKVKQVIEEKKSVTHAQ